MDAEADSLASRIRAARIGIGMSQTELARELEVNRSTIGHWERENGFAPSINHLGAMCRVMGVSETWLLHGENSIRPSNAGTARAALETKMLSLSKHLPISFLASLVALLENAETYL